MYRPSYKFKLNVIQIQSTRSRSHTQHILDITDIYLGCLASLDPGATEKPLVPTQPKICRRTTELYFSRRRRVRFFLAVAACRPSDLAHPCV
jgi:hypothetical protein